MPLIQIEHLSRNYGRRRGVENLSLHVEEGSRFGFLGPNGAGKTTTIRVLLGFLRPSSGTAKIFGRDCWKESKEIKREVGYVPGDLRLPPWLTATKALAIFGAVRGQDIIRPGTELARRFDLDPRVPVREMSRGMRQKLGLIIALAHEPRLLVLDEPTSSLDPLMQQLLQDILRERSAKGHTVFFSSHTLNEVEQLCDRVAIVRDGELVADETLTALRDRAGHDVMIRWETDSHSREIEAPSFLKVIKCEGATWYCALEGPANRLVQFLGGKPFVDLSISRPDLESLFKRFYDRGSRQ